MKKYVVIFVCCILVSIASTAAHCADGPYLGASIGFVMANDTDVDFNGGGSIDADFDNGYALAVAVGGNVQDNIRAEGEFSYQKIDLNKASATGWGSSSVDGDLTIISLLANGYIDFKTNGPITPFLTAGIGIANADVSNVIIGNTGYYIEGDDAIVFAYQLGGGIGIAMDKQMTVDLKYRYFGTSEADFDAASADFTSHNLYVGLRMSF